MYSTDFAEASVAYSGRATENLNSGFQYFLDRDP